MPVPEWLVPMAATLTQERFTGSEWIFERKFDGIRLLAFKDGRDVRLLSRNRLPQHWPELSAAIARIQAGEFPPTPSDFACAGCPALDLVCAGPRLRPRLPEVVAS